MRRLLLLLFLVPSLAVAQDRGAVAVHELVRGLGTTVRVLMIGAHPDDEDTQLITWLARGRQVETAYLSLTRGDGGQNLIGNELGEALGVIRTEELLAARRVDGGRQYFTRAFDFGFSKSAEETFTHWPKDTILRDVVAIVRSFRPHVIVSVFSGTPRDGHGHHQVAGILAREVFDAAADTVRFPAVAVGGLGPWAPLKFYRGVFRFQGVNPDTLATLRINVGEYNPLLGRSYAEIAGESRSQHASQGFGSLQPKGVRWSYLRREATRVAQDVDPKMEGDLFAGIDTGWTRFAASATSREERVAIDSLPIAIAATRAALRPGDAGDAVGPIAAFLRLAQRLSGQGCEFAATGLECAPLHGADLGASVAAAVQRAERALLAAAGVTVEAFAQRELLALGDSTTATIEIHNRGRRPIRVRSVTLDSRGDPRRRSVAVDRELLPDSASRVEVVLGGYALSGSWWRARPRSGDMFQLEPLGLRRLGPILAGDSTGRIATPPWTPAPELLLGEDRVGHTAVTVDLDIQGATIHADAGPIVHRVADPARGEIRREVAVVPPISVLLERGVEYMRATAPVRRQVRVHLTSALGTPWTGRVELQLPPGLRADSIERTVTVPPLGEADVFFQVQGAVAEGLVAYSAAAHTSGSREAVSYSDGYVPIEYPHIRAQRFYRPAQTWVSAVRVDYPESMRVAYVPGVGDNVAPMLQQLGIPLVTVGADTIGAANLSR
ncbi:MAG TPA: PIG-L family deacetylase, partial [Gemmatimonadaceae bacterium]|nr:PIG-L family deacetylase [Gemmatimonadaceae bacterium]